MPFEEAVDGTFLWSWPTKSFIQKLSINMKIYLKNNTEFCSGIRLRLIALVYAIMTVMGVRALEQVVFAPQWHAQAQFAGYFVAKEMGFYKAEGLDVKFLFPTSSISSDVFLDKGKCQFSTMHLADVVKSVSEGKHFVNILQTSMRNGMMLVGRNGMNPMKMKGKRVGIWKAAFSNLVKIMNKKEGLNYDFVQFTDNVSLFLSGTIDATLAMSYNDYYQLMQSNVMLNDKSVVRFSDRGYDIPEEGVYVTLDYYRKNKATAEKFARASKRGWLWCHEHPEKALDIVMKYVDSYNIITNSTLQRLMLKEILRLQKDKKTGKPLFVLRREDVDKVSKLMLECKIIDKPVKYEDIVK